MGPGRTGKEDDPSEKRVFNPTDKGRVVGSRTGFSRRESWDRVYDSMVDVGEIGEQD